MSLSSLIYGKHFDESIERFKSELLFIEEQFIGWFENRKPQKAGEMHGRLHHYYTFNWEFGQISFKFIEDCELPEEIQVLCLQAFYRNFM